MKIPLAWRMVAPILAVSLLLLALGIGAAWYVFRWNQTVAEDLDRQIARVVAAEGLVLSLRDVRVELGRYAGIGDIEAIGLAKESARRAKQLIEELYVFSYTDTENGFEVLKADFAELFPQVEQLNSSEARGVESIRSTILKSTLAKASELLKASRQSAASMSRQNQVVAERVGLSFALLGLCGAVAGLMAGFGIARSVSQSIEDLHGSVTHAANALEIPKDPSNDFSGLQGLVAAMSQVSEKSTSVMNELERARDAAPRQDQLAAVGQLAAGIAHELRNPLAAVKLLVDSAQERKECLEGSDLDVVQGEVGRIEVLLRSFLDFARPAKLRREPADLFQPVSSAVDLVRPRATMQGITIQVEDFRPIELMIDRQQIRQVVINLLNNAIEAQPSGKNVTIRQQILNGEGNSYCVISVSDDGPGIPPALANNVFTPFVSSKETGIGLGLAICRRIVESHGGTIELTPGESCGTRFTLRLPIPSLPSKHEI